MNFTRFNEPEYYILRNIKKYSHSSSNYYIFDDYVIVTDKYKFTTINYRIYYRYFRKLFLCIS